MGIKCVIQSGGWIFFYNKGSLLDLEREIALEASLRENNIHIYKS